jgi:two-component system response regulator RegA
MCSHLTLSADIGFSGGLALDSGDASKADSTSSESKAKPPENPMSADRVKWEHIHRVFELCNRNVSETARRLQMHRRTLQRILSKRSPR